MASSGDSSPLSRIWTKAIESKSSGSKLTYLEYLGTKIAFASEYLVAENGLEARKNLAENSETICAAVAAMTAFCAKKGNLLRIPVSPLDFLDNVEELLDVSTKMSANGEDQAMEEDSEVGFCLFPAVAKSRQSCVPNAGYFFADGRVVVYSKRFIAKDEQIEMDLAKEWDCECIACSNTWTPGFYAKVFNKAVKSLGGAPYERERRRRQDALFKTNDYNGLLKLAQEESLKLRDNLSKYEYMALAGKISLSHFPLLLKFCPKERRRLQYFNYA